MAGNNVVKLASAFPRSTLQNGLSRYTGQLVRITLKFCKNNGSSKGVRDYLENDLVDFAKSNPGVVVYVKPRRHKTPVMVAEYTNGEQQWINCRNNTREEVIKWIDLMRTQNGPTRTTPLRKMWQTEMPSIQGPWTPFTLKHPCTNLVVFPNKEYTQPLNVEQSATEKLIEIYEKQKITSST